MSKSITIQTTHGPLEFSLSGIIMNVLNTSTGANLYSGDSDQRIVNAMDEEYGEEYAARVGQEWADECFGDED